VCSRRRGYQFQGRVKSTVNGFCDCESFEAGFPVPRKLHKEGKLSYTMIDGNKVVFKF
jgi:hypothetical protein